MEMRSAGLGESRVPVPGPPWPGRAVQISGRPSHYKIEGTKKEIFRVSEFQRHGNGTRSWVLVALLVTASSVAGVGKKR
jgi:hypothetical protein